MTLTWHGAARAEAVVNLGPLALIQPLLDQLDIAGIIDRHLPPDPQLEFSHGQVLRCRCACWPWTRSGLWKSARRG
jgi:hypothetical protein